MYTKNKNYGISLKDADFSLPSKNFLPYPTLLKSYTNFFSNLITTHGCTQIIFEKKKINISTSKI